MSLDDVAGLDQVVAGYRAANADVVAVGILSGGVIVAHTDPDLIGRRWPSSDDAFSYRAQIAASGAVADIEAIVEVPRRVVYLKIARSVKDFAALLLASALIGYLVIGTLDSLRRRGDAPAEGDTGTGLVAPIFFFAVLVDNLGYAFLPQLVAEAARAEHLAGSALSLPFTVYYVAFALVLLPAAAAIARLGARPVILAGLVTVASGTLILALSAGFVPIAIARLLCGLGQGLVFIGVQSYALAMAGRVQAGAMIVFGFQGGMICGISLGSLLVGLIAPFGVFVLGTSIAIMIAVYGALALLSEPSEPRREAVPRKFRHDLAILLGDTGFVRAFLAVGIPAKAMLTGVVLFAVPLTLSAAGVDREDIGQIIMVYAAMVMLTSPSAKGADMAPAALNGMILRGLLLSVLGIALVAAAPALGASGLASPALAAAVAGTLGLAVLGLGHGLINAPVVGLVTATEAAQRIGTTRAASTYRLIERIGHAAGPAIAGQVLLLGDGGAGALVWLGLPLLVGALAVARGAAGAGQRRPLREDAA
ncbi:MAG: MFS transporter [Hyphomicrobiaceae bacterium]